MTSLEKEICQAAASTGKSCPKVLLVKLDVTSRESVDRAAVTIEKEFGKLDIVINNAGVFGKSLLLGESDPDDWWNTWTTNVRGSYLIARALLPLLLKGGDKTLITITSVGAVLTVPGLSAYSRRRRPAYDSVNSWRQNMDRRDCLLTLYIPAIS